MNINAEIDKLYSEIDNVPNVLKYMYSADFKIDDYKFWNRKYKDEFIEEVIDFIENKYNLNILEIYPEIKYLGGYYQTVKEHLDSNLELDLQTINNIAYDIDGIFNKILKEIQADRSYIFHEYVYKLNNYLDVLSIGYYITDDRGDVYLQFDKQDEIDNIYEFIMDSLDVDYNFYTNLKRLILNEENENPGSGEEIIQTVYELIDRVKDDIAYFKKWEKEIDKALE